MKRLLAIFLLCLSLGLFARVTIEGNFLPNKPGGELGGWIQSAPGVFQVSAEALTEGDLSYPASLELKAFEKQAEFLYDAQPVPVRAGGVILLETTFRAESANEIARIGYRGYDGNGNPVVNEIRDFKSLGHDWDRRQTAFEVKDSRVAFVRPYIAVPAGKTLVYAYIRLSRLDESEAFYYSPSRGIQAYLEKCKGRVNLAQDIQPTFRPTPNYELTKKGDTDLTDLTDGKFASTQQIWFEEPAVGFERARSGVFITLDLGEVKPVGEAVIRLQGGVIDKYTISFPNQLDVWVSKDGVEFYPGQSLTKVDSRERELSDWKSLYYLPESTTSQNRVFYMYPFVLKVNADARYVCIHSSSEQFRNMFSDELAVLQATEAQKASADYNSAYEKASWLLQHNSLLFKPKMPVFYIAEGFPLQNYFTLENQLSESPKRVAYSIELPSQVTFTESKAWPAYLRQVEKVTTENGRTTWFFNPQKSLAELENPLKYGFGPFNFAVADASSVPEDQLYAVFTSYVDGVQGMKYTCPLEFLQIPKVVPNFKRIDNSIWYENRFRDIPGIDEAARDMGLSTAMYFVRSLKDAENALPMVEKSRAAGRKIRLELEPTTNMRLTYKDKSTTRCVGSTSTCLSNHNEEYQESVNLIREFLKIVPCDTVVFDIEDWEPNQMNATIAKCTRCQAEKERRGFKNWVDFFDTMQVEYVSEYTKAAWEGAEAAGRSRPRIGYYAVSPFMAYNCLDGAVPFLGYSKLFPQYCDEIQNSYYGRSARECHEQMRKVYKIHPNPAILLPWRSAGTGAYYGQPFYNLTEQHILETLMNGAGGMQFFQGMSFESPLDFYYMARAFAMLAPYEDLLMDGELDEALVGDNPGMLYTARRLDDTLLFLAGNYGALQPAKAVAKIPGAVSARVISAQGEARLEGENLSVDAPADDFTLVEVKFASE